MSQEALSCLSIVPQGTLSIVSKDKSLTQDPLPGHFLFWLLMLSSIESRLLGSRRVNGTLFRELNLAGTS